MLNKRHNLASHHAGKLLVHRHGFHCGGIGRAVQHIAVGQHHNHRNGLAVGNQVVENGVEFAHFEPGFLGVGGAADKVENGVFLIGILLVFGRRIDD